MITLPHDEERAKSKLGYSKLTISQIICDFSHFGPLLLEQTAFHNVLKLFHKFYNFYIFKKVGTTDRSFECKLFISIILRRNGDKSFFRSLMLF